MLLQSTPKEILPGIYAIRLPLENNPAGHINTYLIKGIKEAVMVDTGWNDPVALQDLIDQLKTLQMRFEDIDRIIYTHIHPDHFGLAGIINCKYGTKLAVHREGPGFIHHRYYGRESFINELGNWHLLHGGTKENADAVIEMSTDYSNHVEPVIPEHLLEDRETITIDPFRFRVIWTPGHDNDHICLYEEERGILIAGDQVLPDTIPHIGVHAKISFDPHTSYMQSLNVLRDLKIDLVLPGHDHVFADLTGRVDTLISYHERLKEAVYKVVYGGPKTAYQIAREIDWIEGQIEWTTLAPVVQAGLVTKCLSYLKALNNEGKVAEDVDKTGVRIYNAT